MNEDIRILDDLWERVAIPKNDPANITAEQSKWLDVFLSQLLLQLCKNDKKPKEILSFSDISTVGSFIARQFIADVYQLTSHEHGEDELRNYLLKQRGWTILSVLDWIGTKGLSCCKELTLLLISLYPVYEACIEDDLDNAVPNTFIKAAGPDSVSDILAMAEDGTERVSADNNRRQSFQTEKSTTVDEHHGRRHRTVENRCERSDEEDSLPYSTNRPRPIKYRLNPFDFDYFDRSTNSCDELLWTLHDNSDLILGRVSLEQYIAENISAVLDATITGQELGILLLSLLNNICAAEAGAADVGGTLSSPKILTFVVETLSLSHDTSILDVCHQQHLLSLLFTALVSLLGHSDCLLLLNENRVFPMLLRLLQWTDNWQEEFLADVLYGTWGYVQCLLQHRAAWQRPTDILAALKGVFASENQYIFVEALLMLPDESNKKCKVLGLISSCIALLKEARSEALHAAECSRPRHKRCDVTISAHHHRSTEIRVTDCHIANLCMTLVTFTTQCESSDMKLVALKCLTECGICCCIRPKDIIGSLLLLLNREKWDQVCTYAARVLEKIVQQLGSVGKDRCGTCESNAVPKSVLTGCDSAACTSDSDYTSENDLWEVPWKCFKQYYYLVETPSTRLHGQLFAHLLRMSEIDNDAVRWQLFLDVFYPLFADFKAENDSNLIMCCLAGISKCLSASGLATHFLNIGGATFLRDFISEEPYVAFCCSVVEVVIIQHPQDSVTNAIFLDVLETYTFRAVNELETCLEEERGRSANVESGYESGSTAQVLEEWLTPLVHYWKTCSVLLVSSQQFQSTIYERGMAGKAFQLMELCMSLWVLQTQVQALKKSMQERLLRLCQHLLAVVLLAPSVSSGSGELCHVAQIVSSIWQVLQGLTPTPGTDVRHLVDALLCCSTLVPSSHVLQSNQPKADMPFLMSDILPETYDIDTSEEREIVTTEDGYDGDIDSSDERSDHGSARNVSSHIWHAKSATFISRTDKALSSLKLPSLSITFPQVCSLLVSLLVHYNEAFYESWIGSNPEEEEAHVLGLSGCFQKMSALCKISWDNCLSLSSEETVANILRGFSKFFQSREPKYSELRQSLLEIVTLVGRCSLTTEELSLYLSFFKSDDPPMMSLLLPLLTLVNWSEKQTSHALSFPSSRKARTSSSFDNMVPTQAIQVSQSYEVAAKSIVEMQESHSSKDIYSAWACASLAIPLGTDLGWSPHKQGFSFSWWVKVITKDRAGQERKSATASENCKFDGVVSYRDCFHLISVGDEEMILEIWIHRSLHLLVIRVSSGTKDDMTVLAEDLLDVGLVSDEWHHMAVNCMEIVEKKTCELEVVVMLNGWRQAHTSLALPHKFVGKNTTAPGILVGDRGLSESHAGEDPSTICIWRLANLMLFREPVFTRTRAMYMCACGPECSSLTQCDFDPIRPNIASMLCSDALAAQIPWSSLLDDHEAHLKVLQDAVLCIYATYNTNIVNFYPQVVGNTLDLFGSLFSGASSFHVITDDHRSSQQQALSLPVQWLAKCRCKEYWGVCRAISALGGISVGLILFARVVELNAPAEEQAMALRLLLHLVRSDPQLGAQFHSLNGSKMVQHILVSSNCTAGFHMLKALLDSCVDQPIVRFQAGDNKFHILSHSRAVLVDPELLVSTLSDWWAWEKTTSGDSAGVKATLILLRAVGMLIRDGHPFRDFNVAQLCHVHFVDTLMQYCKEHLLYEESAYLDPKVGITILSLCRSLLGTPVELHHLKAISDCLLLLHSAAKAFVPYVRSACYFLLADVPEKCGGNRRGSSITNGSGHAIRQSTPVSVTHPGNIDNCSSITEPFKHLTDKECKSLSNSTKKFSLVNDADFGSEQKYSEQNCETSNSSCQRKAVRKLSDTMAVHSRRRLASSSWGSMPNLGTVEVSEIAEDNYEPPALFGDLEKQELEQCEAKKGEVSVKTSDSWPLLPKKVPFKTSSPDVEAAGDEEGEAAAVLTEGLLDIVANALSILPDTLVPQVTGIIISAEQIIIMANNEDARVRTAVVKVLNAYMHVVSDEVFNTFVKQQGYQLLALQLHQYPATVELVEACISCALKRTFMFELDDEQFHLGDIELTPRQMATFPLILALLPVTIQDLALCHNFVAFLRRFSVQVAQAMRHLLQSGFLEAICKTLVAASHLELQPVDICSSSEQDLLLSDLNELLSAVAVQSVSSAGSSQFQVFNDILHLINFVQDQETESCPVKHSCFHAMQEARRTVLHCCLVAIRDSYIAALACSGKGWWQRQAELLASAWETAYEESVHMSVTASRRDSSLMLPVQDEHCKTNSPAHKGASKGELQDRFKVVLRETVDYIVVSNSECEDEFEAQKWVLDLFRQLQNGFSLQFDRNQMSQNSWVSLVSKTKDTVRMQLGRLLLYLLSPNQSSRVRCDVVASLHRDPNCRILLNSLLQVNVIVEQRFTLYLRDLLHSTGRLENLPSRDDLRHCFELYQWLQQWGVLSPTFGTFPQYLVPSPVVVAWKRELEEILYEVQTERKRTYQLKVAAATRTAHRFESMWNSISESAASVTRTVVDAQNVRRKAYIEHMKSGFAESVQTRRRWRQLVVHFTHERAVWHFPKSHPKSWCLDPTEGPSRVRTRLQRRHAHIEGKYILSEYRNKLEAEESPQPLSFLFDRQQSYAPSLLVERLSTNEQLRFMCPTTVVTPASEINGEILLGESCVYFVADEVVLGNAQLSTNQNDFMSVAWTFDEVREIHNRRFQLRDCALEIFLLCGQTHFLAFNNQLERDRFVTELNACPLVRRIAHQDLSLITQRWREGLMTNFEYLTQLNKFAGRTFNDLMQYPVFPFVLADYSSDILDLRNPANYRNFRKPMAVQKKEKEQHFISNYNYLKQELEVGGASCNLNQGPYHYGSHYSNSGIVLHFLLRLPPFTKMFLSYQDQNFDLPDRTFHSLQTTWRLTSSDSTTDVKELIPEFFFLPEFLRNNEGFDFGVRQNGEPVHHVHLPPWCKGDPRLFILVHRQALESDHVRENLHHWIDLIFGYKQTGRPAVDAINVFHPATYFGFDVDSIPDPIERQARATMVKTYGQTPRQLFKLPHPMVVQALTTSRDTTSKKKPVLENISGLQWGSYLGSPADPTPSVVWMHKHRTPVARLVPLATNDVFGLAPGTAIILSYSKETDLNITRVTTVSGAALVTWCHSDGLVRVKLRRDQPPRPIIKPVPRDMISICQTAPNCSQLWVGYTSGLIRVFTFHFDPAKNHLSLTNNLPSILLGHRDRVTSLYLCRSFSIAVSGSHEGSVIVWDLNSLELVTAIPSVGQRLQAIAVSESSGNIGIITHASNARSALRLYSVNGTLIANRVIEGKVLTLCFSNAPEGISVNAIATGMNDGAIQLWSTWNLAHLKTINLDKTRAIVSLAYSYDSQHLYAATTDGSVVVWEGSRARGVSRTPKFSNLTSL